MPSRGDGSAKNEHDFHPPPIPYPLLDEVLVRSRSSSLIAAVGVSEPQGYPPPLWGSRLTEAGEGRGSERASIDRPNRKTFRATYYINIVHMLGGGT